MIESPLKLPPPIIASCIVNISKLNSVTPKLGSSVALYNKYFVKSTISFVVLLFNILLDEVAFDNIELLLDVLGFIDDVNKEFEYDCTNLYNCDFWKLFINFF